MAGARGKEQAGFVHLGYHSMVASDTGKGPLRKYQEIMVGSTGLADLLKYELLTFFLGPMPGILGLFLRRYLYRGLFGALGPGSIIGSNVSLRQPGKIRIGARSMVAEHCLLSVSGSQSSGILIGENVFIGRGTSLTTRDALIRIDDFANIGAYCKISNNVYIGKYALIAAYCYIGGANHRADRVDIPIALQGVEERGGVIIEDDVWLGAGVKVNDGVRIGKGSIVGAGSVVTRNLPEYSVAYGVPARAVRSRLQRKAEPGGPDAMAELKEARREGMP